MRILICAIRVAGIPLIAGGLLLLQRRYPGDGRAGICVLFMHFIQELYNYIHLSFDLAENAKNSRIPLPISFVSPFQGYFYVKSFHSLLTKGLLPC